MLAWQCKVRVSKEYVRSRNRKNVAKSPPPLSLSLSPLSLSLSLSLSLLSLLWQVYPHSFRVSRSPRILICSYVSNVALFLLGLRVINDRFKLTSFLLYFTLSHHHSLSIFFWGGLPSARDMKSTHTQIKLTSLTPLFKYVLWGGLHPLMTMIRHIHKSKSLLFFIVPNGFTPKTKSACITPISFVVHLLKGPQSTCRLFWRL